jgi:hypothetical protein
MTSTTRQAVERLAETASAIAGRSERGAPIYADDRASLRDAAIAKAKGEAA